MALFKKVLSGRDFADGLVGKVSRDIYGQWPDIQAGIRQFCEHLDTEGTVELPEKYAPFLIVAAIVVDLQAAKTLRGERKFMALRGHVLDRLGSAFGLENAEKMFSVFERQWAEAMSRVENPVTYGVASALYDFLQLPLAQGPDGEFKTDALLMILGQLVTLPIGFTKFALNEYWVTTWRFT